jgi:hypothetical protein
LLLGLLWLGCEVECSRLGHIRSETLAERCGVVRVNPCVFGSAGDGDVGESVVDETAAGFGIYIGDHTPGGEPLCAVRRDGVSVIELAELSRVETDGASLFPVHEYGEAVRLHLRDGPQVAV